MIVGVLRTCHTQYISLSTCNPMWFLCMGLHQGSGLCSSSSRKYPGTEGCYMLQTVRTNSIIVLRFVESQRVHTQSSCKDVTRTWGVVLLNKKIHTLLSQVYCVWQVVKTRQSFWITLYFINVKSWNSAEINRMSVVCLIFLRTQQLLCRHSYSVKYMVLKFEVPQNAGNFLKISAHSSISMTSLMRTPNTDWTHHI